MINHLHAHKLESLLLSRGYKARALKESVALFQENDKSPLNPHTKVTYIGFLISCSHLTGRPNKLNPKIISITSWNSLEPFLLTHNDYRTFAHSRNCSINTIITIKLVIPSSGVRLMKLDA